MKRIIVPAVATAAGLVLAAGPASALTGEAASDQFVNGYRGQVETFLAEHAGQPLLWENEDSSTYFDEDGNYSTVGTGTSAGMGVTVCYRKASGGKKWSKLKVNLTVHGKGGAYASMMYPLTTAVLFRASAGDVAFTNAATDSGRTLEISGEIVSGSGQTADFTMMSSLTSVQLSLTGLLTADGQDPTVFNFATVKAVAPRPAIKFPTKQQIV